MKTEFNPCPCTPERSKRSAFCRLSCPEGQEYERRQREKWRREFMYKEADRLLSEGAAREAKYKRLHGVKER